MSAVSEQNDEYSPAAGTGDLVGSFNMYGSLAASSDPFGERLLRLLTSAASAAISSAAAAPERPSMSCSCRRRW
ncbi:hypothetical protein O4328_32495 [Rhodococcus opacus]|uniref:Uncharacterized protein n=1 Tax=Rhodococcus opacus TaxID=37919 RepID=A0ABT4NPN6_RHOOP|nr:hypothetical protein [Rhodococcus opacus]MCZ4588332.1 hypothetical protein [Rhodococcus opacus]